MNIFGNEYGGSRHSPICNGGVEYKIVHDTCRINFPLTFTGGLFNVQGALRNIRLLHEPPLWLWPESLAMACFARTLPPVANVHCTLRTFLLLYIFNRGDIIQCNGLSKIQLV